MVFWYNIGIALYGFAIKIAALFGNAKAQLFINGRKHQYSRITQSLQKENRKRIWFLVSSLGEFEQARPLIENVKSSYPDCAIILTFFSPSGYEIRKNHPSADYIFYLPLDTKSNARRMLQLLQPSLVFFTKYDYWYHYLHQLKEEKIPTLLFSAVFQSRQIFFKWYGSLHREMLECFHHIFVQDAASVTLLQQIQILPVSIAGDTRIDSVITGKNNLISFEKIAQFKGQKRLIIGGSLWQKDWQLLLQAFPALKDEYRLLLAPHDISEARVDSLRNDCEPFQTVLYSNYEFKEEQETEVMVLNTMGMLSQVYRYADVVWIGGGFQSSGIHNVLEPAVFHLPIFIGPNFQKFIEANALVKSGGISSVSTSTHLVQIIQNKEALDKMKTLNASFIKENAGAVKIIMDYLKLEKYLVTTP